MRVIDRSAEAAKTQPLAVGNIVFDNSTELRTKVRELILLVAERARDQLPALVKMFLSNDRLAQALDWGLNRVWPAGTTIPV